MAHGTGPSICSPAGTRELVRPLPHGHIFIRNSKPAPTDRPEQDYDAAGRWTPETIVALHLPADADFYLCGPAGFLHDLTPVSFVSSWSATGFTGEVFGPGDWLMPRIAATPAVRPHPPLWPAGTGPLVSFSRSGLTNRWSPSLQECP